MFEFGQQTSDFAHQTFQRPSQAGVKLRWVTTVVQRCQNSIESSTVIEQFRDDPLLRLITVVT